MARVETYDRDFGHSAEGKRVTFNRRQLQGSPFKEAS